ncbi:hypothetical protein ABC304_07740 [Microbacterium sp. 1P10UB]|uniref:hypothetical protein n=1 Tax=unclassified Microbacterium TaxID=2609290 RepID=UPI0039A26DC8
MARIQVLPLPTQKLGAHQHTPFILILDSFADDEVWTDQYSDELRQQTGALTVLGYEGAVDAQGSLTLTAEQQNAIIACVTAASVSASD